MYILRPPPQLLTFTVCQVYLIIETENKNFLPADNSKPLRQQKSFLISDVSPPLKTLLTCIKRLFQAD